MTDQIRGMRATGFILDDDVCREADIRVANKMVLTTYQANLLAELDQLDQNSEHYIVVDSMTSAVQAIDRVSTKPRKNKRINRKQKARGF